ncbi:2-methylcitrate dehydratase [Achromobacter sp. RW408]|uniref:MmgE/PrpD family protein n=1 Tax=Achromobacter sp. RW408 TaxID=2202897 RepID=UPI000D725BDC|nr:MmgE/PrpD family protein [Achromobacter sp. RW408]PWY41495.1 2-methylcitrate dehydratase [Achromobacter sp. RW408]
MHAIEVLSAFADKIQQEPLPTEVSRHAKRALIDWYAAAYPGASDPAVGILRSLLLDEPACDVADLVAGGQATARSAALVNGAAAHAAELDDSYRDAMYHPGAATIAAALAACQEQGLSGERLLKAIVTGYEVSTRIGVVLGRAHYQYWHSTGTVGAFGAAAAAGSAYGLTQAQFAHALGTAATFSAGLQQAFRTDSMSKPLHAARAAEAGVLASKAAWRGLTGAWDMLDGKGGLGQAMSDGPSWDCVGDTLGKDFHITRLTFKNHVGCGHTFAAIDAALALRAGEDFNIRDASRIHVHTYRPALDIACHGKPASSNEARFSLRYVVAHALLHGSVRLNAYDDERVHDPVLGALIDRIDVHADPDIDAAFPANRSARIEIEFMSGERRTHVQANRKGDPEDPLSDAELESKFIELATPCLGAAAAKEKLADLWRIDQRADLHNMA